MNDNEFEQFVSDNGKDILRFCRIISCDKEMGDELYQDTMLKLLEKCKKLDCEQNVKSYALSVSVLLWKNQKKKYANRSRLVQVDSINRLESEGVLDIKDEASPGPEDYIMNESEKVTIQKVVAGLPEKYRIPIQMYYSANMSVSEIARIVRIPEGTVKSRMNKARTLLKKELEALGYD